MKDKELVRLETLLLNVSGQARHWWTWVVIGALGAWTIFIGLKGDMSVDASDSKGMVIAGIVLIAVAVVGAVDGYFWSRVARYLELRGRISDERDTAGEP